MKELMLVMFETIRRELESNKKAIKIVKKIKHTVMIQNKIQYEKIAERIDELLAVVNNDTPQNDKEYIELDLLSGLVADYEEQYIPVEPPSIAEVLRLRMAELGINQKGLASLLEVSPSRISEYLNGTSEPTLKIARTMGKKLQIDPHILLGL